MIVVNAYQIVSVPGGIWRVAVPLLGAYQIIVLRGSLIAVLGPLVVILFGVAFVSLRPAFHERIDDKPGALGHATPDKL